MYIRLNDNEDLTVNSRSGKVAFCIMCRNGELMGRQFTQMEKSKEKLASKNIEELYINWCGGDDRDGNNPFKDGSDWNGLAVKGFCNYIIKELEKIE